MAKAIKSPKGDRKSAPSRFSDTTLTSLPAVLRAARQRKQLSQQALARKLGLRQRQISDLERAVSDSRLSTVQNVARALDLELMLIPRPLLGAIEALRRVGPDAGRRPMYALDDETEATTEDDADHVEVGDTSDVHPPSRPPRARKGSRR